MAFSVSVFWYVLLQNQVTALWSWEWQQEGFSQELIHYRGSKKIKETKLLLVSADFFLEKYESFFLYKQSALLLLLAHKIGTMDF